MNEPKISVIVPVYKVEPYLRKCVDSIINQTYKNLEIILVDDGSPDGCPAICDEYAEKDARVRVIHKENGGAGDARNVGLDHASGEYIGFVDADDEIEPEMYSAMYSFMEKNGLDIAFCTIRVVDQGQPGSVIARYYPDGQLVEAETVARRALVGEIYAHPVNRLTAADCWKGIRYPANRLFEDLAVCFEPLFQTKKPIGFLDTPYYRYNQNRDSQTYHRKPLTLYHLFLAMKYHYDYAMEHEYGESARCLSATARFALGVYADYHCEGIAEVKPYVKEVEQFLAENRYILKNDRYMQRAWRIGLKLYYFSKPLFRFVYKVFIKVRGVRTTDEK